MITEFLGFLPVAASLLVAAAPNGAPPAPARVAETRQLDDEHRAKIADVVHARRDEVLTIDAARRSAEDDLLAEVAETVPDPARIGALVAEIANFDDDITGVERRARRQILAILGADGELHSIRF